LVKLGLNIEAFMKKLRDFNITNGNLR